MDTMTDDSAIEVNVGNRILFAGLSARCGSTAVGVWHDTSLEDWGCFRGERLPGGGLLCEEGTECHGAGALQSSSPKQPIGVRLGSRRLPKPARRAPQPLMPAAPTTEGCLGCIVVAECFGGGERVGGGGIDGG